MGERLVDRTYLDRSTSIDNILMDKILPILEKIDNGNITVQRPEGPTDDVLNRLLDLQEKRYEDDTEIVFFTYPDDGTRITINAGDTVLNYRVGTIKDAAGTVSRMSSSLQDQKKEFLRSMAIVGDRDVIIQLDESDKSPVRADVLTGYTFNQFEKLTITATGDTEIAVFACTNPKHSYVYSSEATISVGREEREQIRSDKDSHFTTAIAQNAIEEENLTGLTSDEITITGIAIIADEAKSYRLWFFETDDFQEVDLDNDRFIEFVDFDLTSKAAQIAGTGAYYYAITGLNINYQDIDASNELHVALQNLDAGAKTAGATGEIVFDFAYTPRT